GRDLAQLPDRPGGQPFTDRLRPLNVFGKTRLGFKRIWGARSPDNRASERVMLRAGMVEEGRIRRHLWTRDAWRDSIVHSILDDEWSPSAPTRKVEVAPEPLPRTE
ncbi:GNAT family N-acetyltransferase, partial [Nocardiopsis sp. CNR-923]|uniref:GNAT family N-acetyltransferase n=1 Tax=Nocardiopsis sp. CNR-923 TaxID=1904965 RepID=UPI0021CCEBD5